jgi:hypothetical protein
LDYLLITLSLLVAVVGVEMLMVLQLQAEVAVLEDFVQLFQQLAVAVV